MKSEIQPTLFAVGTLIVCGDLFAAVTEMNTSRKSVKIEGQKTHPMETIEQCDFDDYATIFRACGPSGEEVALDIDKEKIIKLNNVETRPGVELRNYAIKIESQDLVKKGRDVDILPVEWVSLEEVKLARGKLRFRPGVYETVSDFERYQKDPKNFIPGEYSHTELVDQIPQDVYNLTERGLSGSEAVSLHLSLLMH